MKRSTQLVIAAALVFTGYTLGILFGDCRTVNNKTAMSYIKGHDAGCDIVERWNGKLHCVVQMQAEDDALFIIKKEGTRDDY